MSTLLVRLAGIAGVAAVSALSFGTDADGVAALGFAAVAALCYAPWVMYAARQSPQRRGACRYMADRWRTRYRDLLLMRYGGEAHAGVRHLGRTARRESAGTFSTSPVATSGRLFCRPSIAVPSESGQEVFGLSGETGIRASSMGGVTATVSVSLAISAVAVDWLLRGGAPAVHRRGNHRRR